MVTAPDASSPGLVHRPDIDGLRAVAVLPVLFFHADFAFASGGFVGVDVFFVISGFLITSIIVRELERGRFTVTGFYERRVRRIFPALFVVLAASFAFCAAFFLPREFAGFGASAAGAALFVSNFVFWQDVDYFGIAADLKPLLHTWSLAIEEQFYIGFPLALMLLFRFARPWWRPLIAATGVASLALCIWGTARYPVATFYLAPTRAWELMLGAVLASGLLPAPRRAAVREALSAGGLALILSSVALYDRSTPFPGAFALVPCLGAAFVIAAGMAGAPTRAGRFLGLRPVVFVGLVSYSLYLWHWPLLVFARYLWVRPLPPLALCAILALSFVLATLSWRWVEQPFRRKPFRVARRPLFTWAVACMAVFGVLGGLAAGLDGVPQRIAPEAIAWARQGEPSERYAHCRSDGPEHLPLCRIGAPDAPVSFVLWGDSHAGMLVIAVDEAARRAGRAGVVATRPGCAPLLGARLARSPDGCDAFNETVARWLEGSPGVETLLLAAYWRRQATGTNYEGTGQFYLDEASREVSAEETERVFERSLGRLLARFGEREIRIVADAPEAARNVPSVVARLVMLGRDPADSLASLPLARYLEAQREPHGVFDRLARRHRLAVVPVHDVLCPDEQCPLLVDGQLVYRDGDHLSEFGALLLVDRFAAVLGHGIPAPSPARVEEDPARGG